MSNGRNDRSNTAPANQVGHPPARPPLDGPEGTRRAFDWRSFLVLFSAGMVGAIAVLPYSFSLAGDRLATVPVPIALLVAVQLLQSALLLAAAAAAGVALGPRVGLGAPYVRGLVKRRTPTASTSLKRSAAESAVAGVVAGCVIVVADTVIFRDVLDAATEGRPAEPAVWQRFLASLYGGISEEILLRLGLLTLLAWCAVALRRGRRLSGRLFWPVNAIVSVIFALGHLPALSASVDLTGPVVVRTMLLNVLPSLLFGWLYWRRGLEAAIVAHFAVDIVLAVVVLITS